MLTRFPRHEMPAHLSEPDLDSPNPTVSNDLETHSSVLGTRKTPPSCEDTDTTGPSMSKRARTEAASGTRNRLCIGDFNSLCQAVLKRALSHYRANLNNKSPFPDQLEDRNAATGAWAQACSELEVHVEFEERLMKLVLSMLQHITPSPRLTHCPRSPHARRKLVGISRLLPSLSLRLYMGLETAASVQLGIVSRTSSNIMGLFTRCVVY
jgi:hypothetical protein